MESGKWGRLMTPGMATAAGGTGVAFAFGWLVADWPVFAGGIER